MYGTLDYCIRYSGFLLLPLYYYVCSLYIVSVVVSVSTGYPVCFHSMADGKYESTQSLYFAPPTDFGGHSYYKYNYEHQLFI